MKWKIPPLIKVYEAIGAVADNRIEISENSAKVHSSSGNKFYTVTFDPATNAIMTNDNGSYWKGYLGYPTIAFLMQKGVLSYDTSLGSLLKGIAWKDINQEFKNDFDKTTQYIFSKLSVENQEKLEKYAKEIEEEIKNLQLNYLGKKIKPPIEY